VAAVPDDKTLRMVRVFDASRERVFDTFVEQDQFIQWMCPPDVKVEKCRLDPRPGGEWRIEGRSSKGRFATSGKYVEVRRPEGLVFTWAHHEDADFTSPRGHETTVRIEFRAAGQKTELTLIHGPFADTPSYEDHDEGWTGSFNKLEAFLRRTA
jgi:uncharacterized protein YndB with AHSA1/START domain